jgi:methylmalonyl-CoA mutase cobalamin-binding domain/chain
MPADAADSRVRGRVIIGTMGLDQHEVGALAVSRMLARHGFEVLYLGRFNTPAGLAGAAVEEDADVVGVSVHSWEYDAYVDDLVRRCHEAGTGVVLGGSVLTEADRVALPLRGIDAVFGAYATEGEIIPAIDALVARRRSGALWPGGEPDPLVLRDRVVVITGAARGLGRAYTTEAVRLGARVIANDIDADELAQIAGEAVTTVDADVSTPAGARAVVDAALESTGRLDGVVSNAGALRSGSILKVSPEDVDHVLGVHVRATFLLAQAAGRHWRAEATEGRAPGATLVTTTSSAGLYGFRGEAAYSAAKAAVAAFTIVAADEFARFGVTVNGVAPVARTRLTAWMGAPGSDDPADDPLDPSHVAPFVCWLLGPAARQVSGRVFEIGDGSVSVATGWTPGEPETLPAHHDAAQVDAIMCRLVARAHPPHPILTPQLPTEP